MVKNPTDQQRVVILGRTGSGKSYFACALLASRNFDKIPWIIFDYKGEDLIEEIITATGNAIRSIKPSDKVPKEPGLYHMKLLPIIDDDAVNDFLWRVHKVGHVGIFVDEGYTLPQKNGSAFDIVLTQGRSLHIPVIVLYQRPVWMSRFAVAQADYIAVFAQGDNRDKKITNEFVDSVKGINGEKITVYDDLPKYYCLWQDVGEGVTTLLKPAPEKSVIINTFKKRLKKRNYRALV